MKATANGALNLSILDGWWDEAYDIDVGWAIGRGEDYQDRDYQDQVEVDALYQILERDAVPLFYDRGPDGLPRGWVSRMKSAMGSLGPLFNTHRMVHEYAERFYLSAHGRHRSLSVDDAAPAKELSQWKARVAAAWDGVEVRSVDADAVEALRVGDDLEVRARVALGSLGTDDVVVELYHGEMDAAGEIVDGEVLPMAPVSQEGDGTHLFMGRLPCRTSGRRGYTVRAMPYHANLVSAQETGRIHWA